MIRANKTLHNLIKLTLFVTLALSFFYGSEYIIDLYWGDGNGTLEAFLYFKVLIICIYLTFLSHLIRRKKLLPNILLIASSVILVITSLEFVFHVIVNLVSPEQQYHYSIETDDGSNSFVESDSSLGYRIRATSIIQETLFFKNKKQNSATYFIDDLGRRAGCRDRKNEKTKNYACFMGCSFTFGTLVNNQQTLPCNFSTMDTNFISYNYGVPGYGPHQMLAALKTKQLQNDVKQETGILIYTFIDDHVRRVIADQFISESNPKSLQSPYFRMENDSLKWLGSFEDNRTFTNHLYKLLNKSYLLRYFGIKFPIGNKRKYLNLTGEIINQSFKIYSHLFRNTNFYILIYPGESNDIVNHLDGHIKVLDYSKLFNPNEVKYTVRGDPHPSAAAYELIARKLVKDISDDH